MSEKLKSSTDQKFVRFIFFLISTHGRNNFEYFLHIKLKLHLSGYHEDIPLKCEI